MPTATRSSAPSPAWRNDARATARTTSGRGARACTRSRRGSRRRPCRRSRRISTSNCCAAATPGSASSTTCSIGPTARPTPTTRWHCRGRWPMPPRTPASASRCCRCCTSAPASTSPNCAASSAASPSTPTRPGPRAGASPRRDAATSVPAWRSIRCAPRPPARSRACASSPKAHDGPIHIHVAEQQREVDDCLAATGMRPVQWLASQPGLLDARWQLVHATHVTPEEIDAVAAAGAGVVLCPTTEANLGDGTTDLRALARRRRRRRQALHRLRQQRHARLARGTALARIRPAPAAAAERNVAPGPERGQHRASSAERLWQRSRRGRRGRSRPGPRAAWSPAHRADLLVVDGADASLLGVPADHLLDALVFSSPGRPWRDVMVRGNWVVRDHRHPGSTEIAARYEAAVSELWDRDTAGSA